MENEQITISEYNNIHEELLAKLELLAIDAKYIDGAIKVNSITAESIVHMLKEINSIANKTNLLAINASIETFHAASLLGSFEDILAQNMVTQGKLIGKALQLGEPFENEACVEFAKKCGIEEIYITDCEGIVVFTNLSGWSNMKLDQTDVYKILENPDLDIILPSSSKDLDKMAYKIIGVARKDEHGIIQLGCQYAKPEGQLAIDGFGVVAREAKRLADEARETSIEITGLISKLQNDMNELKSLSNDGQYASDEMMDVVEHENILIIAETSNGVENISSIDGKKIETSIEKLKLVLQHLDNALANVKDSYKIIQNPLALILKVAKQTNLLGVRAAIEAAHSSNDKLDFDALLDKHMLIQAHVMLSLLELKPEMDCDEITEIADYTGVDEFWIADKHGIVEITNVQGGKGFAYSNEGQTAPFMRILADPSIEITAPPERRSMDGKVFKYVGIGRKLKGGFIQVGKASKMYGESTAEGFSVVANQIKSLAEQSKTITSEMIDSIVEMSLSSDESRELLRNSRKILTEATIIVGRMLKV